MRGLRTTLNMKIKISEIFKSIQGEGIQSGLPTIFIRTAGCNLRCLWCDTKYAYNDGKEMTIAEIIEQCKKLFIKRVCLTGGEPLFQREKSQELINSLIGRGYDVLVETNGAVSIKGLPSRAVISLDIKCPTSGMSEKMIYANINYLRKKDQVKFVIENIIDYTFAKKIIKEHKLESKTKVLFQPVFKIDNSFVQEIAKRVLRDGLEVRVGLQLHKIIWGNKRGV